MFVEQIVTLFTCLFAVDAVTIILPLYIRRTHTHTRSQRYSSQWIRGGWRRSGWRLVLPCDSPHTSTLLSRKLNWKCGPWKSVAPIYAWTRANDLSFLSGVQAAALALTPTLQQSTGQSSPPLLDVFMFHVCFMYLKMCCSCLTRTLEVFVCGDDGSGFLLNTIKKLYGKCTGNTMWNKVLPHFTEFE